MQPPRKARIPLFVAMLVIALFALGFAWERQRRQLVSERTQLNGEWTLAASELARARERVAWSKRMVQKGYVSSSQLQSDHLMLDAAKQRLERTTQRINELRLRERRMGIPAKEFEKSQPTT